MLNINSKKLLTLIITILVITMIASIFNYALGRLIIKYDQNIEHKRIFSSDSFNYLYFVLLFYCSFLSLLYFLLFKVIFKKTIKAKLLKGIITGIIGVLLTNFIISHLTIVNIGLTIGRAILYFTLFCMSVLLPFIYNLLKRIIVK